MLEDSKAEAAVIHSSRGHIKLSYTITMSQPHTQMSLYIQL